MDNYVNPTNTFFVRFGDWKEAHDAKIAFHRNKREFIFQNRSIVMQMMTSFAFPNPKEEKIREKIKLGKTFFVIRNPRNFW